MKLFEHQAKELFRREGIGVPRGAQVRTPQGAAGVAYRLGPVAVKAQILAGGRGKAGGVRFAATPREAAAAARELLGRRIHDLPVELLRVERRLTVDRELYLGLFLDRSRGEVLLLASARGGVGVEEAAAGDFRERRLAVGARVEPFQGRELARELGLTGGAVRRLGEVVAALARVFNRCDAVLAEVNPLVVSGEELVAADARMEVDDAALYRHPEMARNEEASPREAALRAAGMTLVELEGDIAVLANGAGMAMATLDALEALGGRPANFLDLGGGTGEEPTARALEALAALGPRVILINIFAGITRCDEVARAVLRVRERPGLPMPLVVRLVGTRQAEAAAILGQAGVVSGTDLEEAVRRAVALAGGQRP
ncbi:MAG: succinate--CoA ligase subunit beta [Thermaerobacter sp.]|nr:succinate--CoA ligase subunit beta [Thermaerobacter sp.]